MIVGIFLFPAILAGVRIVEKDVVEGEGFRAGYAGASEGKNHLPQQIEERARYCCINEEKYFRKVEFDDEYRQDMQGEYEYGEIEDRTSLFIYQFAVLSLKERQRYDSEKDIEKVICDECCYRMHGSVLPGGLVQRYTPLYPMPAVESTANRKSGEHR